MTIQQQQKKDDQMTMMNKTEQKNKKRRIIKIDLASPETIRSWSSGEVTKPETINYKSLKPVKDGLFSERIFGPTKNYRCACGRHRRSAQRNTTCPVCKVDIVEASVRRERMGHIELEDPVAHIWLLKTAPSPLSLMLDIKTKKIEEIIYFVSYIVLEPGTATHLKSKMILNLSSSKTSQQTRSKIAQTLQDIQKTLEPDSLDALIASDLIEELKNLAVPFSMAECAEFIGKHTGAKIEIGAKAIKYLLQKLDLKAEIAQVKEILQKSVNSNERAKVINRLDALNGIYESGSDPAWMILEVLPVIPPDIRPIIQLDGGRFTTSEINDLYRRIIIRNERLRKFKAINAPSLIINDARRMLQEVVDAYIDNQHRARPITGKDKRPLKSLTSILKGKQGRFRQNLLGKRVDYSARSVIVVGPELKMYQCGLPYEIAIVLYKSFVIRELVKQEIASNIKVADRMVENRNEKIWRILDQVISERPVMLNRAPTLHRLSIQGFEVVLVKGKAIRLHPLATTAFNADFDGDGMAVHLPITQEAVAEVRGLMLGSKFILGPKDGKPIVGPTQDMVLGHYYLTFEEKGVLGEGMIFGSIAELKIAYQNKRVNLNAIIAIPTRVLQNKEFPAGSERKLLVTTPGKVIFNTMFKEKFPFINNSDWIIESDLIDPSVNLPEFIKQRPVAKPLKKTDFTRIITEYFNRYGAHKSSIMLDSMKDLGFTYSHRSGTSISIGDVKVYKDKYKLFEDTEKKVQKITQFYEEGMLSRNEKSRLVCDLWEDAKTKVQKNVVKIMEEHPKNPIFVMADSGARGNISSFTQLIGMRGLMSNPKGETIEIPIKSSFREGLTVSEYFISTHGARKGFADIALKTADAGYLTRRLVDVAQEVVISMDDCRPRRGFVVNDIVETLHDTIIVPMQDRVWGRFTFEDIVDEKGKVIVPANKLITHDDIALIVKHNIKKVTIRSALTCDAKKGLCVMCYGVDLITGTLVEKGIAVGIIAAQSIGEPGTQLTMQTFHTGGVAGEADITQGLPRIKELLDVTAPWGSVALIAEISGEISDITKKNGFYTITIKSPFETRTQTTDFHALLRVKQGDTVTAGQKLTEGPINIKELLKVGSLNAVQNYILKEVQKVYRLQGIEISDKYIEIIIRKMMDKVQILNEGGTNLLPGKIISVQEFREVTRQAIIDRKKPPIAKQTIFGIKKAPLKSDSFLSAAAFQDTTRVLVQAIIHGRRDELKSIKENVMLGNLIPCGTGLYKSREDVLKLETDALANQY